MSDTTSTDTSTDNAAPTEPVAITLNDLKNMLMVIDVCTQRGAFRGTELTSIGQLHDRLSVFVADAEAKMAPPADATGEAGTDAAPVGSDDIALPASDATQS